VLICPAKRNKVSAKEFYRRITTMRYKLFVLVVIYGSPPDGRIDPCLFEAMGISRVFAGLRSICPFCIK